MRVLGDIVHTEVLKIVNSSHVVFKICFSVGIVFEELVTVFTCDVFLSLFSVTVRVVILEDVNCQEFLLTIIAREFQTLTINLGLESV